MSDSGWGDMLDDEPPLDVDHATGEVKDTPAADGTAAAFVPDMEAVMLADAQLRAARAAAEEAQRKLDAAADALADADADFTVAETKAAEYDDDETKQEWQRAAAHRDVGKRKRARGRAARAVTAAEERLHDAHAAVTAADALLQAALQTPAPPEPEEPTLYYGSVDEFLREFLRKVYVRRIGGDGQTTVWAADWWKSFEAVHRLEALWRAWEHLRLDPATGMSVWWRDHVDHHMPILLSTDGPYRGATGPDDHCFPDKGEFLPYHSPPEGLFPDVRESVDDSAQS